MEQEEVTINMLDKLLPRTFTVSQVLLVYPNFLFMQVPVASGGHPEYREVPVFRQKYCSKHRNDGTASCDFCKRFEVSQIRDSF